MGRVTVVLLISSSIACGGFLGFGDDDVPSPSGPVLDGGNDVTSAEGGSTVDAAEVCETRTMMLGTDAGIAGPDWSQGINTSKGGGSLRVEGGLLVSSSGNGDQGTTAEATLFATRDGNASRIRCDVRVSSSSFADRGRLLELRIEAPQWKSYYGVRIDWAGGTFRTAYQATPTGGTMLEAYPPLPPPTADVFHDIVMEMVLGDAPRVDVSIDGAPELMINPPATGTVARTQVAIGTLAAPPFEPHEVRYESVVCEMCTR